MDGIISLGFEAGLTAHSMSFVSLYCREVFADDNILHLYWDYQHFYFERIYCSKSENRAAINCFYKLSDDDAVELSFLFQKESGIVAYEQLAPLLKKLDVLQLPFVYLDSDKMGRDGTSYTLCVGKEHQQSSFSWWNVETPTEWEELDILAAYIEKMKSGFEIQEKESYELIFSRNTEENGWSQFINKQDIKR